MPGSADVLQGDTGVWTVRLQQEHTQPGFFLGFPRVSPPAFHPGPMSKGIFQVGLGEFLLGRPHISYGKEWQEDSVTLEPPCTHLPWGLAPHNTGILRDSLSHRLFAGQGQDLPCSHDSMPVAQNRDWQEWYSRSAGHVKKQTNEWKNERTQKMYSDHKTLFQGHFFKNHQVFTEEHCVTRTVPLIRS